ncbi:FYN-binding protein 1 isoform X2 [Gouania willdenowi]|uniref:FYN-binding protein 1 isoform X2 n=1 Tax=Gouania willdenowi TaxID=441366 RepID=UPI0010568B87|nr:FYN-binding protein 1 isoform X2 [Gouania willdenowi]
MAQKPDIKAMMARFQGGGASIDETSSSTTCPKQPLHPTISAVQRKPVFGNAVTVPPKPAFHKNANRSDSDSQETNLTKALASRFANYQDDSNSKPAFVNKPLKPFSQIQESKVLEQKSPISKLPSSSSMFDPKPVFPKPESNAKPSWVKEPPTSPAPPKVPSLQMKPTSSIKKLQQQNEENTGLNTNTANKLPAQENTPFKPPSNFRNAQNTFNKGKDEDEQTKELTFTSVPPPKPLASKKPSLKKKDPIGSPHTNDLNGNAALGPKRNPLPNTWALGPAPAKPNRPQKVNLASFKRSAESSSDDSGLKKTLPPTPLIFHTNNQSSHVTQSQPPPVLPSLPPRLIGSRIQQEDFYDDADVATTIPPPLPSSSGHPSQRRKDGNDEDDDDDDDDDGELYVDLDERWEAPEPKKNDKSEKEEKRRLEAEKKDQKEREKKEQEVKKRFKLVGSIEVIHQGKACTDCKGSRTDLSLKQGDPLDIIRVHGNPEGKWLGRTSDGTIGYVKTTSVEIDFNTLKKRQKQQPYEPEVYDDIETLSSDNSVTKGFGGGGGEIYDDCVDPNLGLSPTDAKSPPVISKVLQRILDRNRRPSFNTVVTPRRQSTAASNSDILCTESDDEIYDDVDSQSVPPPPPISSLPGTRSKSKGEEMDPKKQKKLEKEEKDFRKKFKFEGEIRVLHEVTIDPTLTNKKWSSKDLPVKAGEKLDVIVKAVDNKLICRNEDGKFGYVSICHIADDEGGIYDDIGDDCIYDND